MYIKSSTHCFAKTRLLETLNQNSQIHSETIDVDVSLQKTYPIHSREKVNLQVLYWETVGRIVENKTADLIVMSLRSGKQAINSHMWTFSFHVESSNLSFIPGHNLCVCICILGYSEKCDIF